MVFLHILHNNIAIITTAIFSIQGRLKMPYFLPDFYPVVRSLKFIILQLASRCSSRYNRSLWMDYLLFITYIIKKIYHNAPVYWHVVFFATFFAKKSSILVEKNEKNIKKITPFLYSVFSRNIGIFYIVLLQRFRAKYSIRKSAQIAPID